MPQQPLTPELLLHGYAQGVFPMAEHRDADEVYWVDPKRRGVLPLDGFHISRSLARRIRRGDVCVALNQDFEGVVTACADREETWINETIFGLYAALHQMGYAHSLEVRQEGRLIGGVYGVTLGAAFFGESMFSRATDGSKLGLAFLVARLRQTGFQLFDTQFITPHLQSLGAIEVPRARYHAKLAKALQGYGEIDSRRHRMPGPQDVLQRSSHTS